MLLRLTTLTGLCGVLLVLGACPQSQRTSNAQGSGSADPAGRGVGGATAAPEDRGAPAGSVVDRRTGLHLDLPEGWTARSGPGGVISTAWEAAQAPVRLQLIPWDGDPGALDALMAPDPWSWSAPGPYAAVRVADGEPIVTTWREGDAASPADEWVVFGWFFLVDGRGVGLLARVPVSRLEAGWVTANAILATARKEGGA